MRVFANNASSALALTAFDDATTLTVADGSVFPAVVAPDYAVITVERLDRTLREVMHVTNVTGNVLTVTRAREGTIAREWAVNDVVEQRLTAAPLNAYEAIDVDVESRLSFQEDYALLAVEHDTSLSGAGNATTDLAVVHAPKLETARNITVEGSGGTTLGTITAASFDGTANVTIKFDVSEIDCGTY